MHFIEKVFIPEIKQTSLIQPNWNHISSDGAPTQFNNKDIYYWVSRSKQKTKVATDWVIGCPGHNKDLSDSECGSAKHEVDKANWGHEASSTSDRNMKVANTKAVVALLKEKFSTPARSLFKKKGVSLD